MNQSPEIDKISPALVECLSNLLGVKKDSKNPHFKNDYASLEAVIDHARAQLWAHKLAVLQGVGSFDGKAIAITTRILHESGQWIESEAQIPLTKFDAQGAGSAITYGRRYALMAALGLAPVDDDGQAASAPVAPRQAPQNGLGTEPRDTGPGSIDGIDWWEAQGSGASPAAAKRDEAMMEDAAAARTAFRDAQHEDEWHHAVATWGPKIIPMPKAWRSTLRDEADTAAIRLNIFPANRKPK